jgi:ribonuclease HII
VPTFDIEEAINKETQLACVAGIDEAGRGALAGPVVAAAVILPLNKPAVLERLHEVDDSKQLTADTRERLYDLVVEQALAYAVGAAPAQTVDRVGIIAATKQAMTMAVSQLNPAAQYLLIDGRIRLSHISLPQQSLIRGDGRCLSIAAASILAKVTRGRHMIELDAQYNHYGFARHKGYGTPQHRYALTQYGPSPIHRLSFAPLRETLL